MESLEVEIDNNLINNVSQRIEEAQEFFLQSNIGKAINSAIDIGLKAVLPDLIEDQVINIKDAILENGFKEGLKEVINSGLNVGKSFLGIVTGKFENTEQIQIAVRNGGILDKTSDLLDYAVNLANSKGLIDKTTKALIKQGKNTIISSISNKIQETLTNQIKAVEKIEKYTQNWREAYGNQDFSKMETAYKNIEKNLAKVVPLENMINEARSIENIHNLIKNNRKNFNLTDMELELSQKLR